MVNLCPYFQVHQPDRLRDYKILEVGRSPFYLDEVANAKILQRIASLCYRPMTALLKKLIDQTGGRFKCAFSLTGNFIEQCERFDPTLLDSFRELFQTGSVELLAETYHHSLAFLFSKGEWLEQIELHKIKVQQTFGITPTVFRNTELVYADWLGTEINALGYKGTLCEGVDRLLEGRSPNNLYQHPQEQNFKLLLRNYNLTDDIAFRFTDQSWTEWPLSAQKYQTWIEKSAESGSLINLFMDFETFGEHQKEESGIFTFFEELVQNLLAEGKHHFVTPSEAIEKLVSVGPYSSPELTSWADTERDISAWKMNRMQEDAFARLQKLELSVKEIGHPDILAVWRKLTSSDHFYYMSTKYYTDGDVHQYFSPYETPYDAYINFVNVVTDLERRVEEASELKDRADRQSLREGKMLGEQSAI